MTFPPIDPKAYYDASAPELDVLGKPQTRNRHRCEGTGCPYIKIGGRVVYRGSDVLDYLAARTIATAA